jgi:hypothetical protein
MENLKRERGRGRPAGVEFPERIQVYETAEGKRLLELLSQKRGQSVAATVRALVREAAKREGVE